MVIMGLGRSIVMGRKREPVPPAITTAFIRFSPGFLGFRARLLACINPKLKIGLRQINYNRAHLWLRQILPAFDYYPTFAYIIA
jgi:hypothetical protein